MENHKEAFISFLVETQALMFGDFKLKSGRVAPYFVNLGKISSGRSSKKLGSFYREAIEKKFEVSDFDVLFGPAYKGISLSVSTAIAFAESYDLDIPYCYDRKEIKDHGEGGGIIGHKLQDGERVLIIEDVMTSGRSINETVPKLKAAASITLVGEIIAVDRMEVAKTGDSKRATVTKAEEFGMPIISIVTLDDIVEYLRTSPAAELYRNQGVVDDIQKYREKYVA